MKVLVVSLPVWSNENNSGNTLSNVFHSFDAEFAHIYFSEGIPNNNICHKYYQVTDYMVLNHLIKRTKIGRSFELYENIVKEQSNFEALGKKHKNNFLILLRELAWKLCKIETKDMDKFIEEFNPDVIYAPSYGNLRMQRIIRNIKKKHDLPIISYISDDLYNYKSDMSLMMRCYQFFLRRSMHKTFKLYDLVYTMTDEQKNEYEKIFHKPMDILRKNSVADYKKRDVNNPIKMIYAGGLYYGRDDILVKLVNSIKNLNVRLDIYSNNKISDDNYVVLNNEINSFMHDSIKYSELINVYNQSDIALHVESFDKKMSDYTRLSFSTKIVDCLQSGCATLAICPSDNAGFNYLKREDAAYCIDDLDNLDDKIVELLSNIDKWKENGYACLNRNHNEELNTAKLFSSFNSVIGNKYEQKK